MQFTLGAMLLAVGLFAAMLAFLEVGHRIGTRRLEQDGDAARAGIGVVEGAVFALLGLLVAFTFSSAASRFDERRKLIVEEANAIGTAYLRIDLLPISVRGDLRERFRNYLDARLGIYRALPDIDKAQHELASANSIQQQIWSQAVAEASVSQSATMLLLPALNEMFDSATRRINSARLHSPAVLFGMLFSFALLGAMLAGHAMAGAKSRRWLHSVAFAFALAGAVYVILDMEFPRLGLIQIDAFDQALIDLRQSMK
jgi:hypothetical protein